MVIAPINALLNYLLVWGPAPIRLGFIGAPISSACSNYLVTFSYFIYGKYFVSTKAWHPLTSKMFEKLGVLLKLGVGGVGE